MCERLIDFPMLKIKIYDDNQLERLIKRRNLTICFSGVDLVWKYHL